MELLCHEKKRGAVLPAVLLVMILISVIGLGLMRLAYTDSTETARLRNRYQAFWLAEAGLREFAAVVAVPENYTQLEFVGPAPGLVGPDVMRRTFPGFGGYSIDVSADPQNPVSSLKRYTVISTGTALDGETVRIELQAETATFGMFSYSSHSEQNINFDTDDVIGQDMDDLDQNGMLQTDDQLHITGSPDFWAAVRSASGTVDYNDGRLGQYIDPAVFHNGLDLGVDKLDFSQQNFDQIKEQVPVSDRLPGDYAVTFVDNLYVLENKATGSVSTNYISSLGTANEERVIYVTGDVEVKGNVGTSVSVAAEGSVYIVDDLVYTSSIPYGHHTEWPSSYAPDDDEVLGLFSNKRVQISEGWNIGDVDIHATILVTEYEGGTELGEWEETYSGFGAEWDGSGQYDYNSSYGRIYLYGSLSNYRRSAVGLVGGKGYIKYYFYDPRLRRNPAPGTPLTGYEFSEWRML
ncbi:hypothetical protein P9H32_11690 [Pontiella sp. NLcol2]|uniref:Type 4 fimbrial biogenesis protein PilX N-terminal domain-containing protein n=2 Tax=Pontiella agarivorans TaxID=3038953 RepID=A0ABU5MYK2_9BACT|nr:hypothetical protein [Pontiella agarivorans]